MIDMCALYALELKLKTIKQMLLTQKDDRGNKATRSRTPRKMAATRERGSSMHCEPEGL